MLDQGAKVPMRPDAAAGTTYDGGTDTFVASMPVGAGRHTLHVSLFDFGDGAFDSAAFLDAMEVVCCGEQAPGEPWLVADTIAANVRIGSPAAGDDEVWQALSRVGLAEVVRSLPQGLGTTLGEDGAGL